ncbi:MAG: M48 family metalloprotease, partial [Cyanobacteria bacterium P01_A01_bin.105]
LPRFGRVVVSQGLLDQLADDEIAALYAYELSHWRGPDWRLVSVVGLLLQMFHGAYWAVAQWGNGQKRLVYLGAGGVATVCYGMFWLLSKAVGWTARLRTYYRDRTATQLTGNPNGLIRALGNLSFALSDAVAAQGYTPPLVESLALQLPVGAASTLACHGERHRQPLATLFLWDALNPWRSWLSVNQPQPPLGDRLQLLAAYARHWRLTPTLDFSVIALANRRAGRFTAEEWRRLVSLAGPWSGLALGFAMGVLLWGLGWAATQMNLAFLDWLDQDFIVVYSATLLGLGTGILLRMNRFFPDFPDPDLAHGGTDQPVIDDPQWLTAPDLVPSDSLPVQRSGQLIGRPGIANWLGQDLLLQTDSGLTKLHCFSAVGPIGNVWARPQRYLGQTAQVRGWYRRGQQVWIDVQQLQTANGRVTGNHPVWSLVLCAIATLGGLWLLVRGG